MAIAFPAADLPQALRLPSPRPIPAYVQQHAEEAADMRKLRSAWVRAPHIRLPDLLLLDDRLAGHHQGLAAAGRVGTMYCTQALERADAGTAFAAAVNAIENRDELALNRLYAVARAVPDAQRGVISAFGWASARRLQGLMVPLLASNDPQRRMIGVAACCVQRVDPGAALATALQDEYVPLRAQALRAAGVLGRLDLLDDLRAALDDEEVAFEAARALCLLGAHEAARPVLEAHVLSEEPDKDGRRLNALALLLQAADLEHGRHLVRLVTGSASGSVAKERLAIRAMGLLGDLQWAPWLIERMSEDSHARMAGESFAMITGANLAAQGLDRTLPEDPPGGPNDDPMDDNVALDEDEDLPWPDQDRVRRWWDAQSAALLPHGRCFIGAPPSVGHCIQVLRTGTQRQRIAAAHYLCVLRPGCSLFNCAAPAWRQERLLAGVS
jgi:uncharacterized protein (TIGR02270 family)